MLVVGFYFMSSRWVKFFEFSHGLKGACRETICDIIEMTCPSTKSNSTQCALPSIKHALCTNSGKLDRRCRYTLTDLLEALDDRVGTRSSLITSQLPVEHWHAYLNDPTLADAILDRVLRAARKLPLAGESQRKPEKTPS